ncbi:MAG: tetratricopeptide repeat protein [Prevotella sp.]|nr:tetratricopeptide repeat protein [Prevotella sp.]
MRNLVIHIVSVNKRMLMLSLLVSHFLIFSFGQSREQLRDELKEAAEALSFFPDSLDLRLKKAALNMQLEQWEYAKDEYDYVIRRDPNNVAGLYYRAYANEKLGRLSFARADYEAVLRIVPTHFEARLGLALVNQKDRHFTEAMDQINQLVESNPDNVLAIVARANMERERKLYSLAEFDFTRAMEMEPDNTDHLLNRADVRLLMGNYEEARSDLDLLVKKGIVKGSLKGFYDRLKKK